MATAPIAISTAISAPIWPMLPANSESAMNAVGVGSWIIMFCSPAILSMSGRYFSVSGELRAKNKNIAQTMTRR